MKPSTLALSFLGFCVFYICNADWMDQLYETFVEDYLGADYEEVAPFCSSVTAGAEEFDQLIEEFARSKRKWYQSSIYLSFVAITIILTITLCQVIAGSKERSFFSTGCSFICQFCRMLKFQMKNAKEIQNSKGKSKDVSRSVARDEIPVKLLWKGGSLVESSIHCNRREDSTESKILHIKKKLLHSNLSGKCADFGGGDEMTKRRISPSSSGDSTATKMAEIRRLLESEPEIVKAFIDDNIEQKLEEDTKDRGAAKTKEPIDAASLRRMICRRTLKSALDNDTVQEDILSGDEERDEEEDGNLVKRESDMNGDVEYDVTKKRGLEWNKSGPDSKLMNRIRLLESRLRLEELKNKNWVNRMTRAECILQQLNKQVERIEEARPLETRTETLKITSTVTNWASSSRPRMNTQFTLVNQYQPFYVQTPCLSLSEIIEKEIGLPSAVQYNRPLYSLAPTPTVPALLSPSSTSFTNALPQSSFLSKLLSR